MSGSVALAPAALPDTTGVELSIAVALLRDGSRSQEPVARALADWLDRPVRPLELEPSLTRMAAAGVDRPSRSGRVVAGQGGGSAHLAPLHRRDPHAGISREKSGPGLVAGSGRRC